jgi:hypothetical protein
MRPAQHASYGSCTTPKFISQRLKVSALTLEAVSGACGGRRPCSGTFFQLSAAMALGAQVPFSCDLRSGLGPSLRKNLSRL